MTISHPPAKKPPPPEHARKVLIFIHAAGGEIHIGPHSAHELAANYGLSPIDVAGAADYLATVGLLRRDGSRLWERTPPRKSPRPRLRQELADAVFVLTRDDTDELYAQHILSEIARDEAEFEAVVSQWRNDEGNCR